MAFRRSAGFPPTIRIIIFWTTERAITLSPIGLAKKTIFSRSSVTRRSVVIFSKSLSDCAIAYSINFWIRRRTAAREKGRTQENPGRRIHVVIGLEVSRLARNSSDWHRLLEICALTDTLILDEEGLYDPNNFNDSGMIKGLGLKYWTTIAASVSGEATIDGVVKTSSVYEAWTPEKYMAASIAKTALTTTDRFHISTVGILPQLRTRPPQFTARDSMRIDHSTDLPRSNDLQRSP
jgi:hypothetical protein